MNMRNMLRYGHAGRPPVARICSSIVIVILMSRFGALTTVLLLICRLF